MVNIPKDLKNENQNVLKKLTAELLLQNSFSVVGAGGLLSVADAAMPSTTQLIRGKAGAVVGAVQQSPHPSTPAGTKAANEGDNPNFFNDSGIQNFAQNDSARNMMTQEEIEQEHTAKPTSLQPSQTMKSNACKSIRRDSREESDGGSGFSIGSKVSAAQYHPKQGTNDSFSTPHI